MEMRREEKKTQREIVKDKSYFPPMFAQLLPFAIPIAQNVETTEIPWSWLNANKKTDKQPVKTFQRSIYFLNFVQMRIKKKKKMLQLTETPKNKLSNPLEYTRSRSKEKYSTHSEIFKYLPNKIPNKISK